jgi:magnesium transporter
MSLQVLEVCLDHISASMAAAVHALEVDSTAALDALAQRVNAGHLDAARRVKNGMVRLSTRVDTVRTLLEKYLADDADLAELHLSGQRCARPRMQRMHARRRRHATRPRVQGAGGAACREAASA